MYTAIDSDEMLRRYIIEADKLKIEQGIILIPDVSGFTNFVSSICIEAGRYIMRELLMSIIQSNTLGLEISEVEGDAVLFYKFCNNPTIEQIVTQYELMLKNFREKLELIEELIERKLDVSLKLIAHYGSFTQYTIGNFSKLYGDAVVQSHALLKNTVQSDTYLLLTKELLQFSKDYQGMKHPTSYTYIDYKIK
ncbi:MULTISPECIES: DUF2652 domain-containing protein [Flavobacterium]|uniref:DUF2652 domain-containing protein n=1 Tax=Flavobacterium TaxID=237 RepID=UPI0010482E0F|nr:MULTISPECIES: DUF2652 domain-containing protein [Flavobacterium]KAF2506879.1 DUF2652 domain-containing protein [Flavobacterium zhairuonense]WPO77908.1 DUF2652 domain-containing protein [Flavobacterium sp. KACC 22761]